jgi:hypothetical protein
MATLRLLLSLLLVAMGTTAGAFAISGYFETAVHASSLSAGKPVQAKSPPHAVVFQRQRFVAGHEAAPPPVKAKPKMAAKSPQHARKKHVSTRPRAVPAPPPQQQAAAIQWPWSGLFKN